MLAMRGKEEIGQLQSHVFGAKPIAALGRLTALAFEVRNMKVLDFVVALKAKIGIEKLAYPT
jgi:hypothetical protein